MTNDGIAALWLLNWYRHDNRIKKVLIFMAVHHPVDPVNPVRKIRTTEFLNYSFINIHYSF